MAGWFGSKKNKQADKTENGSAVNGHEQNGGTDNGANNPPITVTDTAREKIGELIRNAASPVLGVRVLAEASSPMNPQYSLAFVQEGEVYEDDTVLEFDEFRIYVDADSAPHVQDVKLDFMSAGVGGGFRINKVMEGPTAEGPVADKVQTIIDQQINPALAMHGGSVSLIDIKGSTAYIELGGGCRGCGMVDVTLKQGIEVMIKQNVPEITEILDTTDHASGSNPYYQPSK